MTDSPDPTAAGRPLLDDEPPVPGGVTAIRDGQYVTEERTPGPPAPRPDDGPHPHVPGYEWFQQGKNIGWEKGFAAGLAQGRAEALDGLAGYIRTWRAHEEGLAKRSDIEQSIKDDAEGRATAYSIVLGRILAMKDAPTILAALGGNPDVG